MTSECKEAAFEFHGFADKRNKQGLTTMSALSMSSDECYVNQRAVTGCRANGWFRMGANFAAWRG